MRDPKSPPLVATTTVTVAITVAVEVVALTVAIALTIQAEVVAEEPTEEATKLLPASLSAKPSREPICSLATEMLREQKAISKRAILHPQMPFTRNAQATTAAPTSTAHTVAEAEVSLNVDSVALEVAMVTTAIEDEATMVADPTTDGRKPTLMAMLRRRSLSLSSTHSNLKSMSVKLPMSERT